MSMSTHVVGFRPPDEKWLKMKAVWDACKAAGTTIPAEVDRFFESKEPDPSGIEVWLDGTFEAMHSSCKRYNVKGADGFEIDISKLPPNITKVRFFNSW